MTWITDNLHVGDTLEHRETRRKGKQIKVLQIGTDEVLVENTRNADGAFMNTVGKQYNIKASRILDDYKVIESAPREEEDAPMTPEEEEEFASLTADNHNDSSDGQFILLATSWPTEEEEFPHEDEEYEISPAEEEDLHQALKSVGYYKLPNRADVVEDIEDAIKAMNEDFDLTLEETVELVFDYIRSID